MANITLMGASYTDVPAVTLPQTGGGTVTFYENGGGGGGDQSLIKSADLTMSETYTNANKLTVALEARTACVILVWADELPSAPASGYTAIVWTFFIASGISQTRLGRILRANGTVGNDDSMASFNTATGELNLGGQYGYFREGMTYHIRQYDF